MKFPLSGNASPMDEIHATVRRLFPVDGLTRP